MKYITYILITIIFGSLLISAIPNHKPRIESQVEPSFETHAVSNIGSQDVSNKKHITIYCTTSNPTASDIITSAQIIEDRLTAFGIKNYKVSTQVKGASISIDFDHVIDMKAIKTLLTTKGKIEFYETESVVNFIKQIGNDFQLDSFQVISDKDQVNSEVLGYSRTKSKVNLDQKLKLYSANKNRLFWNYSTEENGMYALHLLKAKAFLNNSDVSKSGVKQNDINEIKISFTKAGSEIFEKATKDNIGQCIAFVIDEKVYFTPMVHSIIKGGKCTISGGFSISEAQVMHALISNKELPLEFELR